jgi:hypothetical protein
VKTLIGFVAALAVALPASAQTSASAETSASAQRRPRAAATSAPRQPKVRVRPFFIATGQEFTAKDTFKAAFGSRFQPFLGGGVEVTFLDRVFVDVTATHFGKTGQRVFRFNGQTYRLNIPLKVSDTPIEFTGGYRFKPFHRFVPYVGGGGGIYLYSEKSDFADPGDNVDTSHAGVVAMGGIETPVVWHRWVPVRLSFDAEYSYVPGILGYGGVSAAVASGDSRERDLGGIAARVRVIVGK